MTVKNTRFKEIDILYSIGAILAVFGHSHPLNWDSFNGSFFYHCIVFVYTFHMPLFFFVAGVLLTYSKSIDTKPFIIFIKEKALKLLTPYIILTLLTLIPKGFLEFQSFKFLNINFIIRTIFNPRANIWGHFWFLPVLFICYILFGYIRKLISNIGTAYKICVLSACLLVFGFLLLYPPFNTDWLGLNDIFKFAFYMPFGMLIAFITGKKYQTATTAILPLVCAIFLLGIAIAGYVFFYYNIFVRFIISLLMIFCFLGIAVSLRNKCEKIFTFLSRNIFTIYIYSWPFQSVALIILEMLGFSWKLSAPIIFVLGIVCPLILVAIYKRFKKLNCHFLDLVLGIR